MDILKNDDASVPKEQKPVRHKGDLYTDSAADTLF